MKEIFLDLNRVFRKAALEITAFAKKNSNELGAVVLVGSVSKKTVRNDLGSNPSDIDLIFIVGKESEKERLFNRLIAFINLGIAGKYGISCYPITLSKKEYLKALEEKENFILKAHIEGELLYGRKPRRFS